MTNKVVLSIVVTSSIHSKESAIMTGNAHARLLFVLSRLLIQTSPPLLALPGTVMRESGTTKGTKETGVEVHLEKEAPGVVQEDLTKAPHLGEDLVHMTSSHHGGTSLTSPHGVKGNPHFLHGCRHVVDEYCGFYFFQQLQ